MTVCAAPAVADSFAVGPDQVAEQCAIQYPENAGFAAATAYVAAPGDANSWRCQRLSLAPGGGTISDLSVDVANYCARNNLAAKVMAPGGALSWVCVS